MAELNPDNWPQLPMLWFALSRWENEGGAGPFRATAASAIGAPRHDVRPWANVGSQRCGPLNNGTPEP